MDLITKTNNNWLPSILENIFDERLDTHPLRRLNTLPAVNIEEKEDSFILELAAPGKKREDFSIELNNELLTISSELKEEKNSESQNRNFTRKEFNYTSFKRSFTLPDTVDFSKIDANYNEGVLKVHLPKREEAKKQPKRMIDIS